MVGGNDGLPLIPQPTRRQRNTPAIAAGAATKAFAVEAAHQVALAQSFLAQVVEPVAGKRSVNPTYPGLTQSGKVSFHRQGKSASRSSSSPSVGNVSNTNCRY